MDVLAHRSGGGRVMDVLAYRSGESDGWMDPGLAKGDVAMTGLEGRKCPLK